MNHPADRLFAMLEPVWAAETMEAASAEVARQLGPTIHAVAMGFFVVLHGRMFLEFFYPDDLVQRGDVELHLQRLAVETARQGVPLIEPFPGSAGLVPHVHAMHLQERLTAVLCYATVSDAIPPQAEELPPMDRILRLIQLRLISLLELEAERRKSGQYQRWFRNTDKQIRALDLERQKFAGLVNAIHVGVFVTDRDRVIRWNSQPLLGRYPVPADGPSWVGKPCEQFCRQLGVCDDAGGCLVARVFQTQQPVDTVVTAHGDAPMRVSAVPIHDLDGQPHEVMVAIQHLSSLEREAA